jgi:exodeoxyribonuclease V beta subunit
MNAEGIYDPNLSVALSASAGSGKTFTLTTRLITMLLNGIGPSEILAITFTNLAANEIRRKLFDRLQAIVDGDRSETDIFSGIFKEKHEEIVRRAAVLKNHLIKQFSLLQISTIHSFFTKLIRCFPGETGYLTDILVTDDIIKEKNVADALELFYEKIAAERTMLERVFRFVSSYRGKAVSTAGVIKDIYQKVDSKYYILKDIKEGQDNGHDFEDAFNKSRKALFSSDVTESIKYLTALLSLYIENHGPKRDINSFIKGLEDFLKYKNINRFIELTPFQRNMEGAMIRYLKPVCAKLAPAEANRFKEALSNIRRIIINYLQAEMGYYLFTWMDIHRDIYNIYSEIKKKLQSIDFSDIEMLAVEFLSGLKDFEYLGYRTGSQIRYVMIDEFQDTSRLEWDALEYIVRNGLTRGGKLFYVGDIKQSIYRWRGGDPWLFEKVRDELSIPEKHLKYSYRQAPVILNFVNRVFKNIQSDPSSGFAYREQSLSPNREDSEDGYVHIGQCQDKDELFDKTISWIKLLQKHGVNLDDIAVLCRKNSEIEEIEKCMIKNRLPYVSVGKSKMYKDFSVMDIVNIINFTLNPDDGLHLAGLLRSSFFRFSYDELDKCSGQNGVISLSGLASYQPRLYEALTGFLIRSQYLSPSGFIRGVFEEFGALDKYPQKTEILLKMYEISYAFENAYDAITLYDFADYLEQNRDILSVNISEERGVRLLTIHSSKGLEFHTVIVPFLNSTLKFRRDGPIIFNCDEKGHVKSAAIARSKYETYFSNDKDIREIFDETEKSYRVDELNILYVALTRAKKNLIVLPLSGRGGGTIGDILVSSYNPVFDSKDGLYNVEIGTPASSADVKDESAKRYDKFRVQIKMQKTLPYQREDDDFFEDEADFDAQTKRTGLLKGLIFHSAVEMIKKLPVDSEEVDEFLTKALALDGTGFTRSERVKAFDLAKKSLINTVTDKRIEKYFNDKSFRETITLSKRYVNFFGRIDRLVMGDEIEVLDFKTNRINTEEKLNKLTRHYRTQIDTYCRSLMNVYPGKPVKGYLYFTDAEYDSRLVQVFYSGSL